MAKKDMQRMRRRATKGRALMCLLAALMLGLVLFSGCDAGTEGLEDGYYTAQIAKPDHGWTEFMTICVNNGKIVTMEFQAKNASGFIKSWDMDYMRVMNATDGTYPNEYVRVFTKQFLEKQSSDIDVLTGATDSYNNFKRLAAAVMEQAKLGDKTVKIVDTTDAESL
ncbi:MAG: FMN-binding protein [Clostridiales Family XIII bacterium]|nr:FMN-binding protein [Clostridiales Family XIII bacterium]